MIASQLETRTEASLVFSYEPDSFAHEHLDSIVAGYSQALAEVCAFLGLAGKAIPTITIHLRQFRPTGVELDEADGDLQDPAAEILAVVNSESPGQPPAIELAGLLLPRIYGPLNVESRFWYDGLARYFAKRCGSEHHAEAPARVQKLFEAGQLPPLVDLLALYGIRQSSTGKSVATAFVEFLIGRYGPERFKRFLAALRDGQDAQAVLRRVYGVPLQSLEQAWYRSLEAASTAGTTSMLDAIKQLRPYLVTYRAKLAAILVCIVITISFTAFMPMAIRFLVNNILARAPLPFALPGLADVGQRLAAGPQQTQALWMLLGAMIFMFILSAVSNTRRSYLVTSMGEGVNFDLRMRFFNRLQRMPIAYHRRTPNQDLTSRFWTDIGTIALALTAGLVPMAQAVLAMAIFGAVLISLNWKLSIIALLGLPIFAVSFQRMRARTRDAARERTRRQNDVGQSLVETLNAQEKLKLYGLRDYLTRRFADRLDLLRDLVVRITLMASTTNSTSALITNGAQVAVLIVGGMIVIDSQGTELTTGDLMAFYVLLLQLYAPAGLFTSSMQFVNQATTSLDRANQVLEQPIDEDAPDAVEIGPLREALRFESVSYGKAKGKDLIKDLTLEIPAGGYVAFVGPPGAGKASLMELLPRFFDLAGGAITWDGRDLRTVTAESLRRNLAVISQETFVFNATVYDNIRYGRVAATDDEVIRAAQLAGLHEFILGLPGGYDTQVNDRDASFSLVQRQRLAVARAILQDASVILMDDALSALDAPSQRELENILRGRRPDGSSQGDSPAAGGLAERENGHWRPKTMIRLAQRIGSVREADRIFVMDSGQLVQQGTHDELTEQVGGLYAQLLTDELGAGAVSGAFQAARRLHKQAIFSALPDEVIDKVAQLMLYTERQPGDIVCRQGSVGDELFFIGRGEVDIVLEEDGTERIVNGLHEGDYFGEISFVRRVPRTATVRARTPVELHVLRRQDFDAMLNDPAITAQLDQTAQARIDLTQRRLAMQTEPPTNGELKDGSGEKPEGDE